MAAVLGVGLVALLGGCGGETPAAPATSYAASSASPSVRTLSPLPAPPTPPATGRLYADMRQSSRDAALGRMEVWLRNDTTRDLTPTRILYDDPRLLRPLAGERLRLNPARSERGYPLTLPRRPDCDALADLRNEPDAGEGSGTVTVWFGDHRETLAVEDETDVVGRYAATRCLERAVASVAQLSWSDDLPVTGESSDAVASLTLRIEPTGRPGPTLRLLTVGGTPLLTSETGAAWTLDRTVRGTDPPSEIALPMIPSRCDDHVFMESGGATAFRIRLRLDGVPGDLVLRMSPAGASSAIGFARDACGL